jgi:hypothetical protein
MGALFMLQAISYQQFTSTYIWHIYFCAHKVAYINIVYLGCKW